MNKPSLRVILAGLLAVILLIVGISMYLLFSIYFSKSEESLFPQSSQVDTGEHRNASSTSGEVVVTSTVVLSAGQENTIDTSEWKTYRNEEMGFYVKAPIQWGEPEASYYGDGSVSWDRASNPPGLFIERLIVEEERKKEYLSFLNNEEQIELNGMKGYQKRYQYQTDSGKTELYNGDIWLMIDDTFYVIKPTRYPTRLTEEQEQTWKKVISTFQTFKPTVEPESVSIFRDASLNLEMRIPNRWMIAEGEQSTSSIHFVSKWRDELFEINTINLIITKFANLDDLTEKYASLAVEKEIYRDFDQLKLDLKNNLGFKPVFADYSNEDRPSFWGNGLRFFVKDGEEYYGIWYMATGSTKERVEGYDVEFKKFLETIKKIN